MNKDQKFYNPYPFPVRILNDLGETYLLAPQDYSKVLNGRYEQSKLTLLPLKEEREFYNEVDVKFEDCLKSDLIPIAWAVDLDDVDQSMTKVKMIKAIMEKIHETDFGPESEDEAVGIGDVEDLGTVEEGDEGLVIDGDVEEEEITIPDAHVDEDFVEGEEKFEVEG